MKKIFTIIIFILCSYSIVNAEIGQFGIKLEYGYEKTNIN